MTEEHFFQSFFPQQPQPMQQSPEFIHNEIMMEMANNWDSVRTLAQKIKDNTIQQVDQFEHTWYNAIVSLQIDILGYSDSDSFLEAWWKN